MIILLLISAVSIGLQHKWSSNLNQLIVRSHPTYSLLSLVVSTTVNLYRMYFITNASYSVPAVYTFEDQISLINSSILASQPQTEYLVSLPRLLRSLYLPVPRNDSIYTGRLLVSGGSSAYGQSVAAAIDEYFNNMRVFSLLTRPDAKLVAPFTESNELNRGFYFAVNNTLRNYKQSLMDLGTFLNTDVMQSLVFRSYFEYICMPVVILISAVFVMVKTSQILSVQKQVIETISLLKSEEISKLTRNCRVFIDQLEDGIWKINNTSNRHEESNISPINPADKTSGHNRGEQDPMMSTERNQLMTLRTSHPKNEDNIKVNKSLLVENQVKESPTSGLPFREGSKRRTLVVKEISKFEKIVVTSQDHKEHNQINHVLAMQSKIISRKIYLSFVLKVVIIVIILLGVICGKLGLELTHYSQAKRALLVMSNLFRIKANLKIAECILYTELYNKSYGTSI